MTTIYILLEAYLATHFWYPELVEVESKSTITK